MSRVFFVVLVAFLIGPSVMNSTGSGTMLGGDPDPVCDMHYNWVMCTGPSNCLARNYRNVTTAVPKFTYKVAEGELSWCRLTDGVSDFNPCSPVILEWTENTTCTQGGPPL